jgi:hypothetical protein
LNPYPTGETRRSRSVPATPFRHGLFCGEKTTVHERVIIVM